MNISLEAKVAGFTWDAVLSDENVVATVEFKNRSGLLICDWWVSGLTPSERLVVLGRFSFGLGRDTKYQSENEIAWIYKTFLQPLIEILVPLEGMPEAPNSADYEVKRLLSLTHLELHEAEGRLGEERLGKRVDIARQYQLIKSFGLSGAQGLIAERLQLPLSTITRRLHVAREVGLIEKMSEAVDRNAITSKRGSNAQKN